MLVSKASCQRRHAKRRAQERYGLTLNRAELERLVRRIQHGEATVLERQSHRISVFGLIVQGVSVRVVYDAKRKTIVSFLPLSEREATSTDPCSSPA